MQQVQLAVDQEALPPIVAVEAEAAHDLVRVLDQPGEVFEYGMAFGLHAHEDDPLAVGRPVGPDAQTPFGQLELVPPVDARREDGQPGWSLALEHNALTIGREAQVAVGIRAALVLEETPGLARIEVHDCQIAEIAGVLCGWTLPAIEADRRPGTVTASGWP